MFCGKGKLISLCLALWTAGSVYAIDEFEELARNGGFEEEIQAADWIIEVLGNVKANLTRDKEEVFAGKYSAFFEVISFQQDRPQLTQKGQKIEAGEEYTLSFWAKAEELRPAELHVIQDQDPWTKYASKRGFNIGTEWAEYWMTFEAPVDDDSVRLVIRFHNSDANVWVDNVHFYVGDHIEEADMPIEKAVSHVGALTGTWGKAKSIFDF
jgi:hypothetical protein